MPKYNAVHLDTGTTLKVTIKDNQTNATPSTTLSSAVLRFSADGKTRERTMTVDSASLWKASYQFTKDDLALAAGDGIIQYEVKCTDSNSKEFTTLDRTTLRVRTRLPDERPIGR